MMMIIGSLSPSAVKRSYIMKAQTRYFVSVLITAILLAPSSGFAQQPFSLEPSIKRIHDGLALNDEQTSQVRDILTKHEPEIAELRQRAQKLLYSQKLQQD